MGACRNEMTSTPEFSTNQRELSTNIIDINSILTAPQLLSDDALSANSIDRPPLNLTVNPLLLSS